MSFFARCDVKGSKVVDVVNLKDGGYIDSLSSVDARVMAKQLIAAADHADAPIMLSDLKPGQRFRYSGSSSGMVYQVVDPQGSLVVVSIAGVLSRTVINTAGSLFDGSNNCAVEVVT